jgi:hypothetical protein
MESTFFRGMVLFLALTGFGASRRSSSTPPKHTAMMTDPTGPMPTCPPNDPDACGIH